MEERTAFSNFCYKKSRATFAEAIGAGLEKPERVRKSTYSYRQFSRYEEVKKKEEKKKREADE